MIRIRGGVYGTKAAATAAVQAAEQGRADYAFAGIVPALAQRLVTTYPQLRHATPATTTSGLLLNTRLPPFDHLAVRQALSFAVDRRLIVRLRGGPLFVRATCQLLPPNFPSYKPYCPYTLDRSPGGAPNLARAGALVRRSGTRGMRVFVWTLPGGQELNVARYLARVLTGLGYRASAKATSSRAPSRAQAVLGGWLADYPAPGDFVRPLFTCLRHQPADAKTQFCDRRVDVLVAQADRLQPTDPEQTSRIWARLDRLITDRAPSVFLTNPLKQDVVSARVGNYQYNPVFQILLDQLWVH